MNLELRVVFYLAIGACFSLSYGSLIALGLVFADIIARQIPWKRIYHSNFPWRVLAPFAVISIGIASTFFGFISLGILVILYGYFIIGKKVIKVIRKEFRRAKDVSMEIFARATQSFLNKIYGIQYVGWILRRLKRTVLPGDNLGCPTHDRCFSEEKAKHR